MKAVLVLVGVLAIAGCAMDGKRAGTHQPAPQPTLTLDDIAFSVAHAGAGPVNPANVYDRLFPINDGNSELDTSKNLVISAMI